MCLLELEKGTQMVFYGKKKALRKKCFYHIVLRELLCQLNDHGTCATTTVAYSSATNFAALLA